MKTPGISLRFSVTQSCQLRCRYCRSGRRGDHDNIGRSLPQGELMALLHFLHQIAGIAKLRFTGGEPLLRHDLPELVAACAELGIADLALTTNGQRLAEFAGDLKQAGLHRVNVSLDSLDKDIFSAITRGGDLTASLAGIEAALAHDLQPLKLNMVVLRGVNDHETGDMLDFALKSGCHIRFLELMPIGVAAIEFDCRFIACQDIRDRLTARYDLQPLPYETGATSRDFMVRDASGRTTVCGFISPSSHPFCHGCTRLRLTADGRLLGCLANRRQLDLRPALAAALAGDSQPLAAAITDAFALKRQPHNLADQCDMTRIGG
ncbi:MAG: radical SAM protein [Candidatus Latescibacter sp.]|nr:radical SAM protein [Candidatus Latescibacter sp.]